MNEQNQQPVQTVNGEPINAVDRAGYTAEQRAGMELADQRAASWGQRPQPGGRFIRTATLAPNPPAEKKP